MCVFCGITQAPVCAAAGPCTTTLQSVISLALVVGGSVFATARLWVGSAGGKLASLIRI